MDSRYLPSDGSRGRDTLEDGGDPAEGEAGEDQEDEEDQAEPQQPPGAPGLALEARRGHLCGQVSRDASFHSCVPPYTKTKKAWADI